MSDTKERVPPGPDELRVEIRQGSEFEPSETLRAALENLSSVLADEFGGDVQGYGDFDIGMDPLGFCVVKFTGGGGCSKVRCSGTYTPSGGGTGTGGGGGTASDGGDTIPIGLPKPF